MIQCVLLLRFQYGAAQEVVIHSLSAGLEIAPGEHEDVEENEQGCDAGTQPAIERLAYVSGSVGARDRLTRTDTLQRIRIEQNALALACQRDRWSFLRPAVGSLDQATQPHFFESLAKRL